MGQVHITDQDVVDLQYLFISRFDVEITEDQARDYGYWLIETVKILFLKTVPIEEYSLDEDSIIPPSTEKD